MSQSIDHARERAVWERVRAGRAVMETESEYIRSRPAAELPPSEPADCPPAAPSVTPELLLDWIRHETEDACLYRRLAQCLPPCARRSLTELANDEQTHARRLSAHYYVVTGQQPRMQTQYTPSCTPLELLRRRWQEELDGSAAYLNAARGADGMLMELLEELSRDEARHSRMVMYLLESVL